MKNTTVFAAAVSAVFAVGCEQRDTLLLESTTTDVPCQGGVATSADGRFSLRFEADTIPCGTDVTIETIRDFGMSGLVSHVYRVGPKDLVFARDAEVAYSLEGSEPVSSIRFVRVDEDRADVLVGSAVDTGGQKIRARVRRLDKHLFAVHERSAPSCEALACTQSCVICERGEAGCATPMGYCDSAGFCRPEIDLACVDIGEPEGWTQRPGTGQAFVVNRFAIADRDRGFDIDGICSEAEGCVDNRLWRLGELMNDQIRQSYLGGENLILFEIAGLPEDYRGDAASVTTKIYEARDADDPYFPANNFKIPPGHTTCCEFLIASASLAGTPPQAHSRAPGRIERGRLRTLAPVPIQIPFILPYLFEGTPPYPQLRMERALLSARVPSGQEELEDGLIGATLSMNALASTPDPFCQTVSPRCPIERVGNTMADLVVSLVGPATDVDLDGDGLECTHDLDGDGRIDLCCDGVGDAIACNSNGCTGSAVPPIDPVRPHTCALAPEMADGYSIAFEFTAVPATVVGIADR